MTVFLPKIRHSKKTTLYMDRQLDFTVDQNNFKDLPKFVDDWKELNIRFIPILDPALSTEEPSNYTSYKTGLDEDVYLKNVDGSDYTGIVWPYKPNFYTENGWDLRIHANVSFPDFFNPATQSWWKSEIKQFYEKTMKFDGIWIDMNEPANFATNMENLVNDDGYNAGQYYNCSSAAENWPKFLPKRYQERTNPFVQTIFDKTICMDLLHKLSASNEPLKTEKHYNLHSMYGYSQSKPTLEAAQEATGERSLVVSRSTFPGSQKYAGHWLGDNSAIWRHMKQSIIGMMEFSMFGFSYTGADICGFFGDTTVELCERWMELGAFYATI